MGNEEEFSHGIPSQAVTFSSVSKVALKLAKKKDRVNKKPSVASLILYFSSYMYTITI